MRSFLGAFLYGPRYKLVDDFLFAKRWGEAILRLVLAQEKTSYKLVTGWTNTGKIC